MNCRSLLVVVLFMLSFIISIELIRMTTYWLPIKLERSVFNLSFNIAIESKFNSIGNYILCLQKLKLIEN